MTKSSYLPKNDQHFLAWIENFIQVLNVHLDEVGLISADIEPVEEAEALFAPALGIYFSRKILAEAATVGKNATRKGLEDIVRPLVRRISNHPGMTDELRELLGIDLQNEFSRKSLRPSGAMSRHRDRRSSTSFKGQE
jgi:hypothetical protein